jgi:hypothetical protein
MVISQMDSGNFSLFRCHFANGPANRFQVGCVHFGIVARDDNARRAGIIEG